jgi:regulator of replication initiation timing
MHMTSNLLADQIGQLDAQIKVLTEQLETLKKQAKDSGNSIRASLDTTKVKKELGQQWYDDHCKLAEVTTVRVKVRPEALI